MQPTRTVRAPQAIVLLAAPGATAADPSNTPPGFSGRLALGALYDIARTNTTSSAALGLAFNSSTAARAAASFHRLRAPSADVARFVVFRAMDSYLRTTFCAPAGYPERWGWLGAYDGLADNSGLMSFLGYRSAKPAGLSLGIDERDVMIYLFSLETGRDNLAIGFPSVDSCLAVVLQTTTGLYGWHSFNTALPVTNAKAAIFAAFIALHPASPTVHLYAATNRGTHGGDWDQELRGISAALNFHGPATNFDIHVPGEGSYVEFHRNAPKRRCEIYYTRNSKMNFAHGHVNPALNPLRQIRANSPAPQLLGAPGAVRGLLQPRMTAGSTGTAGSSAHAPSCGADASLCPSFGIQQHRTIRAHPSVVHAAESA